ncbi:PHP-associated domain-containing protein [Halomarina ordinaria]|uniref:PHP-associated domain-containing protein n=1 Tax=Halomarina ordinaria TaxID=3033939 RepID=A0ABD5U3U4_9EURY|nr:PHP-associated domain-containing protein [Halomarina sp. PSRA2]
MFALDLHTHTRFFHGFTARATPFDPVGSRLLDYCARWRGLDGVAFTNHDYYEPLPTGDTVSIPGIEVTTTRGHVLVVGPDPPRFSRPERLSPEAVVEMAHDRDCAAIIAHPYRNSTVRDVDAPFDAIEVNGKHPRTESWVRRLADEHGLPLVGGSDAHYPVEVGRAYTRVDAHELTPRAIVTAIREGRVEPRVGNRLPDRLIRGFYHRIHQQKRHLQRPDWADEGATPGVGRPPGEDD